jgi:hypothetical protein
MERRTELFQLEKRELKKESGAVRTLVILRDTKNGDDTFRSGSVRFLDWSQGGCAG